jgi:hypothetical protein
MLTNFEEFDARYVRVEAEPAYGLGRHIWK